MLGKVETVVLGLLASGPKHAYEIVQKYRASGMDQWVSVGDASIYQAMPRLERRGLIEQAPMKKGTNKKTYRLTNAGRQSLKNAITRKLASSTAYDLEINIGVGFIDLLKREEAVKALADRRKVVLEMVRSMGRLEYAGKQEGRSLPHDMIALQRFNLARAELDWLDRTIQWLGGNPV